MFIPQFDFATSSNSKVQRFQTEATYSSPEVNLVTRGKCVSFYRVFWDIVLRRCWGRTNFAGVSDNPRRPLKISIE